MIEKKESPAILDTLQGINKEVSNYEDKSTKNILYTESFVSEKLKNLIETKHKDLQRPKPDWVQKNLQNEILFLQNEIMPIILNETIHLYSEITNLITNKIHKAVQNKADIIVAIIPLQNNNDDTIKIGTINPNRENPIEGIEITIEANGRKIEEIIL